MNINIQLIYVPPYTSSPFRVCMKSEYLGKQTEKIFDIFINDAMVFELRIL